MSKNYVSAKIIDSLYKEFLGRSVDPDGLRHHMNHFLKLGIAKGTQCSVNILMNSDEFQENKMHRGKIIIKPNEKLINGKSISHIISLGSHCLPALTLRKYGLKGQTLPFDWTYATPQMVIDCLRDNFTSFINTSNIHTISAGKKSTNIKYWWESKYHTFPHHDLNQHESMMKFKNYINRFNRILESDDAKLFLIISRRMYKLSDSFLNIRNELAKRTNNFHLVGVQLLSDDKYKYPVGFSQLTKTNNCELYNFSSNSTEEGFGEYQCSSDEMILMSLLTKFSIDIKHDI